jgi:hypothetical protein
MPGWTGFQGTNTLAYGAYYGKADVCHFWLVIIEHWISLKRRLRGIHDKTLQCCNFFFGVISYSS